MTNEQKPPQQKPNTNPNERSTQEKPILHGRTGLKSTEGTDSSQNKE